MEGLRLATRARPPPFWALLWGEGVCESGRHLSRAGTQGDGAMAAHRALRRPPGLLLLTPFCLLHLGASGE